MPELPEVETMVRGIRQHVAGRVIEDVLRPRCVCRPIAIRPDYRRLRRACRGRRIDAVDRLAKRVLLRLDSGEVIAIEPRMTGLMLVTDPPSAGHLRMEWQFADSRSTPLWFWDRRGLGTITLYTAEEFADLRDRRMGRDALHAEFADWRRLCAATARPIKVALLDQKLIAGIGNLYASEILHLARIHPATPARTLRSSAIKRLAAATRSVLEIAIQYEGSTLSDGTYRNALNKSGGYQNEHRVYARAGAVCRTCERGTIERVVQAQRSTFYCPRCQRGR